MNISFALTTPQIKARTKDVTRRLGWLKLKAGARLTAVVKGMGLRKGETVQRLAAIEVVSVRREWLNSITQEDVVREGFPTMTRREFIDFFCRTHRGCTPTTTVTRIEFRYL